MQSCTIKIKNVARDRTFKKLLLSHTRRHAHAHTPTVLATCKKKKKKTVAQMARVKWLRTVSDTIILSLYLEKGLELACACALKQLWVAVKAGRQVVVARERL